MELLALRALHTAVQDNQKAFQEEDTSLVFVGFPITSLQKFIPESAETTYGDDNAWNVNFNNNNVNPDNNNNRNNGQSVRLVR